MAEGITKVLHVIQLVGLPCVHATKVILLINRLLESYVPAWFETYMYFVTYHNYVKPVPGMNFWPDQSMYSIVLPPKPRKIPGKPKKKRIRAIGEGGSSTRVSKVGVDDLEDVDAHRGPVRDEGASGTRGGAIGSRGRGGVVRSRGGASGSICRGAGGSGGASRSRYRGTTGSRGGASGSIGRGAGGSKRKPVSTAKTQKRQGKKKVGTSGFAKWFGLQDEPEQSQDEPENTQAEPQQTQHVPEQTQVEDQVEQTEDQAEIDLTQVEQTQEQTQEQV
ncbi:hypothetical protein Tco_0491672 [Tanacetum coccineum]